MSIRTEKVASVIKRALSSVFDEIGKEYSAGLVTVTNVTVSPDLQNAKIFFSVLGNKLRPLELIPILELNIHRVKGALKRNAELRYIPDLKFYVDDTLDQMEHIQKLIDKSKLDQTTA